MAWGGGGSLRSCDALLQRVEDDDPQLTELVILPMKAFGAADADRLSRAIESGANTCLRSISASGHPLPPESLKRLGLALSTQAERATRGITSLAIGAKDMGDGGVIALCEGLEGSRGGLLQFVDLGWKNLGYAGVRAIGRTFASSASLTHLDLSRNNSIGNEGMIGMADAAKESAENGAAAFPSLEVLAMSECNIGPPGAQSLADVVLGPGGSGRGKPLRLAIGSNPVGPEGCVALARLVAIPGRGSAISKLQLTRCSVGDQGIESLSAAASSRSWAGLTALELSENSITKDGARVFSETLMESWPDLTELNLAKNDLGDKGVAAVTGALVTRSDARTVDLGGKKNATLSHLDLSRTNCGIDGAKSALRCGGLAVLRLFDNRLGSDGFCAVAPLLRGGHPSLESLDLGGNSADEGAVVALLNAIADRGEGGTSKLAVLEIGGNKFGEEAMAALQELRRVWPGLDVAHDKPVRDARG